MAGLPVAPIEAPVVDIEPPKVKSGASRIIDRLFGTGGEERFKTWPEKLIRDALSAPHDVLNATELVTSDQLVKPAMDMSALAGTGGLAGTGAEAGAALGAGPFLRPALKFKEKIYKAPVGGQHLDALPESMIPEFNRLAMSGEDISHYNFGFMNHKGQFLSRENALDYAIKEGLIDPNSEAARAGVLTSTMDLMADSSKPAAAIKALEKLKQQGYDIDNPVYHQSNTTFDTIKPSYGTQVWFSNSKDALANNGASGTGKIATAYLKNKNLADWDKYDKYTTDQLLQMGYNGAQLGNDIVMFEPKNVKIHSWEDNKK